VGDELTPAVSLHGIVARTEGYTYAAKVWDLNFSVAGRQSCWGALCGAGRGSVSVGFKRPVLGLKRPISSG
jgi:hypothetical protein